MKLKIFNIEESIRITSKHRHFDKWSDALALPEQLLQFIL
jgi:hypothetical protein